MRGLISLLICMLCMFASTVALATTPENQTTGNKISVSENRFVLLYEKPNKLSKNQQLLPTLQLVPIYRQGNWMKVGDPRNGNIGWVNLQQYQKARDQYYQPKIQTLTVGVNSYNKNGQSTLNVVAYRNGKLVTKDEALKLYQQINKDEQNQLMKMQQFSQSMQEMINQNFLNTVAFSLSPAGTRRSVIIIERPDENSKPQPEKKIIKAPVKKSA